MYEYSFLILLLPAFSFLLLGLAGMKMSHKTAGIIGTTSLGLVTVLSYMTAFSYFSADRLADGTFATIVPYNFTWLPLGRLHFDMGARPDFGDDARRHFNGVVHGTHLFVRLHARRERFPALLRIPFTVHDVDARTGCCHEHLPDVPVLGTCGCEFISAYRFLLSASCSSGCFEESIYRDALCRHVLPDRYSNLRLLYAVVQFLLCWSCRDGHGHNALHSR